MHFEQQGRTLTALIPNPRKTQPERSDLSGLSLLDKPDLDRLLSQSALSAAQAALLSKDQLFHRFLGLLNHTDMAVAMALLIREHAKLTLDSLAAARLLNNRGKFYLLVTDEGQKQIFSVDKPRASGRSGATVPGDG